MSQPSDAIKTIVTTVAEYERCPPEVLPALDEKIDSGTYRQLATITGSRPQALAFEHLWYQVTVLPEGEVIVTP